MRNLHRIMGSVLENIKPNQCPYCQHYATDPQGWDGICKAKGKRLAAPITDKGRCPEFVKADVPHWDQAKIDEYMRDGKETRERRQQNRRGIL